MGTKNKEQKNERACWVVRFGNLMVRINLSIGKEI